MKNMIKSILIFSLFLVAGMAVAPTTSKAGCYYQKKIGCYKQSPSSPSNQWGYYDVWVYSDGLKEAIENVINGGKIYYISTHGSKELPMQTFVNKTVDIIGTQSLQWDDPSTGWYSDSGYGNKNGSYHQGVKNVQTYTGELKNGMPELCMKGTNQKYRTTDKLATDSNRYQNVYGVSLIVQGNVTISGIKFTGMCGAYNNPCSLLMVNNGAVCNLLNVWVADNDWYTYQGKKASDISTEATEQRDGIGNPGGGITVYGGTCTVGNVKISNCHGYFSGGGVHVGHGGQIKNADNRTLEIVNCSASSGGGMSAVSGGKIYLWATGATVSIHNNYIEKHAYQAYNPQSNLGYTAGNIHIGGGSYCRLGCSGSTYQIYNGGVESAYTYAEAGSGDVGNIVCKGELVTDHDTYIYDGDGVCAAEVYVTAAGTWTYGNNGTITTIGMPNGQYSESNVWKHYDKCGASGSFSTNSICSVLLNAGGTIHGNYSNSILNMNVSLGNSSSIHPWRILYNKDKGSLAYRGTIKSNESGISDIKSIACNTGAETTITNAYVQAEAGEVRNEGSGSTIFTFETNTFAGGLETKKGASTYIRGTMLDCQGAYVANWGHTRIGSYSGGQKPKVQNAILHNYSGSGQTYANKRSQGNDYQSYYTSYPANGSMVFENNTTSGCRLTQYGGYVRLEQAGAFNDRNTSITIQEGSLHMDGDDIQIDAPIDVDGSYANLHISNYRSRYEESYPKKAVNTTGRIELDGKGQAANIMSQDVVDLGSPNCRVTNLINCGFGKIYHRYGAVTKVYNGKYQTATNTSSGTTNESQYYQSYGTVNTDGYNPSYVYNYANYHVGDESCETRPSAKILATVVNSKTGTMTIGTSSASSSIGEAENRKNITNEGNIDNRNGKIYAATIQNKIFGHIYNQSKVDTEVTNVRIDAGTKIVNDGSICSYAGTISSVSYENRGTTMIRGTLFRGCNPVNTGTFSILNPLLPEQSTVIKNSIINEGVLNVGNEETEGGDLSMDLAQIENHHVLNLNLGDPDSTGNPHRSLVMENGQDITAYYNTATMYVGPAVTLQDEIINQGTMQFRKGNDKDTQTNSRLGFEENKRQTVIHELDNQKEVSSESEAKVKVNVKFTNQKEADATMYGQVGLASSGMVKNDSTMKLYRSLGETGYAGTTTNTGTLTIGGADKKDKFTFYSTRDGEYKYDLSTEGGTTTVLNGEFTGINNYPVFVQGSQFIIDDNRNDVVNGKKITIYMDDVNGTWQNGQVPVLDNSNRTSYMVNFEKNKYANDELVRACKVPLTKLTKETKLQKWSEYVKASMNKQNICLNNDKQERYNLYTHAEQPDLPEDSTVYLYFRDITPPTIRFDGSKDKYVEVDCRYGSHSTEYLPLKLTDDISGIQSIQVKVTNLDKQKQGLADYENEKSFTIHHSLAYTFGEDAILSLHNDALPITFGNLKITVTATDAVGNTATKTKFVMAGRIQAEIYDKFQDSQGQSGNSKTYWNFMSLHNSEDEYIENIGTWLAGDQKWLKLTLEGFWDSAEVKVKNDEGNVDMSENNKTYSVQKTKYKTINGKVSGKATEITIPLKARNKNLSYTGVITTKKEGSGSVKDQKTFTFHFCSIKKKTIESSIEKRILLQGTQRKDGSYTDGFNVYP